MSDSKSVKDMNTPPATGVSRGAPRKPYAPPKLQVYGSVAKLTRGGTGTGQDGSTTTMKMVCL
jgi:hypothetical protein